MSTTKTWLSPYRHKGLTDEARATIREAITIWRRRAEMFEMWMPPNGKAEVAKAIAGADEGDDGLYHAGYVIIKAASYVAHGVDENWVPMEARKEFVPLQDCIQSIGEELRDGEI